MAGLRSALGEALERLDRGYRAQERFLSNVSHELKTPIAVVLTEAQALALSLAKGPTAAHAVTKQCLNAEWDMSIDAAITHEAQAQARCMETEDFARAYRAFVQKHTPVFEGD